MPNPRPSKRPNRGFQSASRLLQDRIKQAGTKRGFGMARLLTHWEEIVGADIARLCEPVKVGYARKGGFGATLTVLVRGPAGPIVQAQSETIRQRVNACYGHTAISKIRLTQTSAAQGFAEDQASFAAKPRTPPQPSAEIVAVTSDVQDPDLRAALAGLGARVTEKNTPKSKG